MFDIYIYDTRFHNVLFYVGIRIRQHRVRAYHAVRYVFLHTYNSVGIRAYSPYKC